MRLHRRHFYAKDLFRFRGQFFDDIFFEASEHECAEFSVQVLDFAFLVGICEIKVVGELDWNQCMMARAPYTCRASRNASVPTVLPSAESISRSTFDVVLQRRPRDQQSRSGRKTLKRFIQLRLAVFESMRFIHGKALPFDLLQILSVFENELVCSEQDVEFEVPQWSKLELANDLARLGGTHIADDIEIGGPSTKLHLPS